MMLNKYASGCSLAAISVARYLLSRKHSHGKENNVLQFALQESHRVKEYVEEVYVHEKVNPSEISNS